MRTNCGFLPILLRARNDSFKPIITPKQTTTAKKCKNLNVDTPFGINEYGGYKRTVNSIFQECSNVEKRLVETTVVQYHHFMNHGEFKVSFGGVVNGHSAILNHNYLYQQIETDNAEYQYIIIVA